MIRPSIRHTAIVLAALALLGAAAPMSEQLALKPESRLWIDGGSTVRDWSCAAKEMTATIDADAAAPTEVLAGRKPVRTVRLVITTNRLDCENRTMNGHMLKALNAEQQPTITFELTSYDVVTAPAAAGTLRGTLTINGQTRPITLPVGFASAAGALRVTGAYPLTMTEWGVQPPTLMLGTLKVKPLVTVNFDLLLQP